MSIIFLVPQRNASLRRFHVFLRRDARATMGQRRGQWPRRCPIAQISLKSHVTTLYWPIRELHSFKSPTNNRNFRENVRFHPKFFPHLKSKAVRTALLKNSLNTWADKLHLKIYKSKKNQQKWIIFSHKNSLDAILGFLTVKLSWFKTKYLIFEEYSLNLILF